MPLVQAQDHVAEQNAIRLMKSWRDAHPNYHLHIDTIGQFVKTSADSFRWIENSREFSKTDYHLVQPNEARVVFESAPGDVIAYFPETHDHVLTKMLPGDADLLTPKLVGNDYTEQLINLTKVCQLGTAGQLNELKLVFVPTKINVFPSKADITIFIRFDNDGMVHEIEQRRLGLKQVSTMNFLTFDLAAVKQAAPATPDPGLANGNKSYEDALQDDILYFMKARLQRQRASL